MKLTSPVSRKKARIEIIPLIDIVFFLLATFVMVSMSMVKNQGIAVNLPRAGTAAAQHERASTTLTVTKGDDVFFNKEKISIKRLPAKLAALRSKDPDPKVLINGDAEALLGSAVAVLDEVRKSGITKVSIQTKGKE